MRWLSSGFEIIFSKHDKCPIREVTKSLQHTKIYPPTTSIIFKIKNQFFNMHIWPHMCMITPIYCLFPRSSQERIETLCRRCLRLIHYLFQCSTVDLQHYFRLPTLEQLYKNAKNNEWKTSNCTTNRSLWNLLYKINVYSTSYMGTFGQKDLFAIRHLDVQIAIVISRSRLLNLFWPIMDIRNTHTIHTMGDLLFSLTDNFLTLFYIPIC